MFVLLASAQPAVSGHYRTKDARTASFLQHPSIFSTVASSAAPPRCFYGGHIHTAHTTLRRRLSTGERNCEGESDSSSGAVTPLALTTGSTTLANTNHMQPSPALEIIEGVPVWSKKFADTLAVLVGKGYWKRALEIFYYVRRSEQLGAATAASCDDGNGAPRPTTGGSVVPAEGDGGDSFRVPTRISRAAYNQALSAHAKGRNGVSALELLGEMRSRGGSLSPTRFSFNTCLKVGGCWGEGGLLVGLSSWFYVHVHVYVGIGVYVYLGVGLVLVGVHVRMLAWPVSCDGHKLDDGVLFSSCCTFEPLHLSETHFNLWNP